VSFTLPTDPPISDCDREAIERAKRIGTYKQIDRRAQYMTPQHARPEALLEAVNVQGNHIRGVQASVGQVQHDVYNLKLRNSIVVAIVTAVLMRAPEIAAYLYQLFR
jgi:hypothetical protein